MAIRSIKFRPSIIILAALIVILPLLTTIALYFTIPAVAININTFLFSIKANLISLYTATPGFFNTIGQSLLNVFNITNLSFKAVTTVGVGSVIAGASAISVAIFGVVKLIKKIFFKNKTSKQNTQEKESKDNSVSEKNPDTTEPKPDTAIIQPEHAATLSPQKTQNTIELRQKLCATEKRISTLKDTIADVVHAGLPGLYDSLSSAEKEKEHLNNTIALTQNNPDESSSVVKNHIDYNVHLEEISTLYQKSLERFKIDQTKDQGRFARATTFLRNTFHINQSVLSKWFYSIENKLKSEQNSEKETVEDILATYEVLLSSDNQASTSDTKERLDNPKYTAVKDFCNKLDKIKQKITESQTYERPRLS